MLLRMLLLSVACMFVCIAAVHVVTVCVESSCCRRVNIRHFSVHHVCVASVLVAMTTRVMGGVLGAAAAPRGSRLQRSERRVVLTKLRSPWFAPTRAQWLARNQFCARARLLNKKVANQLRERTSP